MNTASPMNSDLARQLQVASRALTTARAENAALRRAIHGAMAAIDSDQMIDAYERLSDAVADEEDPTPPYRRPAAVAPHDCSICRNPSCTTEHACE